MKSDEHIMIDAACIVQCTDRGGCLPIRDSMIPKKINSLLGENALGQVKVDETNSKLFWLSPTCTNTSQ